MPAPTFADTKLRLLETPVYLLPDEFSNVAKQASPPVAEDAPNYLAPLRAETQDIETRGSTGRGARFDTRALSSVISQIRGNSVLLALLIFLVAVILCPPQAEAATFNVRDFGAAGNGSANDQPALQRAIDAAIHAGKGAEVVIPAGTYRLGAGEAGSSAQLKIDRANALTVRGEGKVLLVSEEPRQHLFAVERSSNIHIEHLLMDRHPLLFTQGIVTGIDVGRKTAKVDVDQGYDPLDAPLVAAAKLFIVFSDPGSGTWGDHSAACAFYKPDDPSVCWPPTIIGRRHLGGSSWDVSLNTAPENNYVGKKVLIWSGEYNRLALLLKNSGNILVEDVHYFGGGGNGFVVTHCTGEIALRNFSIDIPPGSNRLFAGTGGGMVFNNHAHLVLDHVRIKNVWDDDLNIGANYARIFGQIGPTKIKVDGTRSDFAVGDHLSVLDWITKSEITQARISSLDCSLESHRVCSIGLDRKVVIGHPGFAEIKSKGNDTDGIDRVVDLESAGSILVEDSDFQSLHAHCLLIKSSYSAIRDSRCSNTVFTGIMIGPEFFWDEGPQAHDVVIRNNIFSNVSGPSILVTDGGAGGGAGAHNISIVENKFMDFGQYSHGVTVRSDSPVLLQKVDGTSIEKNKSASRYAPTSAPLVADLPTSVIIR